MALSVNQKKALAGEVGPSIHTVERLMLTPSLSLEINPIDIRVKDWWFECG